MSTRTLPIALINLFAAFLDDPGQFVGLFVGQAASGSMQGGFPLQAAIGVETVNIVSSSRQPAWRQGLEFFEDRFEVHPFKLLSWEHTMQVRTSRGPTEMDAMVQPLLERKRSACGQILYTAEAQSCASDAPGLRAIQQQFGKLWAFLHPQMSWRADI